METHSHTMEEELVAPCGMNCNVCGAYLAAKHDVKRKGLHMRYCLGCRSRKTPCAFIKKGCDLLLKEKVKYCYDCPDFPCDRLSAIDRRYRENYRVSEIENLCRIRDDGIEAFLESEEAKWRCEKCGGTICCHNGVCFDCSVDELKGRKRLYRLEASGARPARSRAKKAKGK